MGLWQSFLIALGMLRLHKLRAFLTMLGVIIGVFSVTIIIMISNGFQYYVTYEFKKLGADTIFVSYDGGRRSQGGPFSGIAGLRDEDLQYLKDQVPSIDILAPMLMVPSQKVLYEDRTLDNPRIFASDDNFHILNRLTLIKGRHISETDIRNRANVCVIGEEVITRLGLGDNPLGKLISFKGITLEVVGVYKRFDMMGQTNARDVLVPITTAQDKWLGGRYYSMISFKPKPGYTVEETMDRTWEALMRRSDNRKIYRLDSRESIMNILGGVVGAAGVILALVAALSLLVGGIGIMNIMLVSVTERTKEVGLRKAVGAKSGAVLTQFLVESATLSLVGGLIGMFGAWMLGNLVTLMTIANKWPSESGLAMPFPVVAGIAAAAFSALIGVVFGLYPAIRAAKLSPIEALRTD
ncbi:MAG: ABC transporter permease [Fimbriimonadaceae bacterium]|nr:ABC transporter permease [Fimbriimonadaceae bacterium]